MARTLVIKNADFSANKVTTVSFSGDIPCTGITFASESITITGYDTETVEYTLTPVNTTDIVSWESSNTDIITVANGVITPVGVGTCTLTATCGSQTATATVTVSISYIADWKYNQTIYQSATGTISISSSYARIFTGGTGLQETEHKTASTTMYPVVKLPKNVGSIKISASTPSKFNSSDDSQIIWTKDESAGESYPYYIHALSAEDKYNIRTTSEKTYTVPVGADSFVFATRLASAGSAEVDPNTLAEAGGLTIVFLPAA